MHNDVIIVITEMQDRRGPILDHPVASAVKEPGPVQQLGTGADAAGGGGRDLEKDGTHVARPGLGS